MSKKMAGIVIAYGGVLVCAGFILQQAAPAFCMTEIARHENSRSRGDVFQPEREGSKTKSRRA